MVYKDFLNTLFTYYTSEQLSGITTKARQNLKSYATDLGNFHEATLWPMLYLDTNKHIKTTSTSKYSISATEMEYNTHAYIGPSNPENPNNYTMHFLYVKRGLTIVYNYLTEDGYIFLDRISLYLQKDVNHKIRAYRKNNSIVIISNENNDDVTNLIFSALPLIFQKDYPWTEKAIQYFKAATKKTPDTMLQLYTAFIAETKLLENMKKEKLEKELEFTTSIIRKKSEKELDRINKDIQNYENSLIQLYRQQKLEQAKIAFYTPLENLSDTVNYILNNPYIVDYFVQSDRYLVVAIEAPLEYVDVPALKKMLSNVASYLYPRWSSYQIPNSIKENELDFIMFLKDIFISGKYKIYTRAEIVFDFEENRAFPLRYSSNYGSSIHRQRPTSWAIDSRLRVTPERCITPHMHIEYYDCWSGNKTNIAKALQRQDVIGALDIAINTTKDINVNDSAVFGRFIGQGLFSPREFNRGATNDPFREIGVSMPGNTFKTIYDPSLKCFRTFDDIFQTDYLMKNAIKVDPEEGLEKIII